MSKSDNKKPPAGEIRQSQILSTFGPGSMVDLPNDSVIIAGLNHWRGDKKLVHEPRLASRVAQILGVNSIQLYAPPINTQDPRDIRTGVKAFIFPTWFLAQVKETWEDPRNNTKSKKIIVHVL